MLLLTTIIFVTLVFFYYKKKLNYWNERGVPNLQPITPLGDAINCILRKKNINVLFKDFALDFKKKGHKFYGFYLSHHPIFVPIDYELIRTMLIKDNEYFPDRGVYIDKKEILLGENIFSCTATRWKYLRQMFVNAFGPSKLKLMAPVIDNYSKLISQVIREREGKPIDIFDLVLRYVCDIACGCYFGIEENNMKKEASPLIKFCRNANKVKLKNLLKVCLTSGLKNPAYVLKAFFIDDEVIGFINDFCEKLYYNRKESKIKRNDLFGILFDEYEKDNNNFDFSLLKAQVLITFLATLDTTAKAITFCLYEAGKSKDFQLKLRNEIVDAINDVDGKLCVNLIKDLDYLERFCTGN